MKLTEKEIQNFKEELEKEAVGLELQVKNESKTPDFGSDTDDSEEEQDEAEEFANQLGTKNVLKERLGDVERALEKIMKNEYGQCEKCHQPIEIIVLKADSTSRLCKACKAK